MKWPEYSFKLKLLKVKEMHCLAVIDMGNEQLNGWDVEGEVVGPNVGQTFKFLKGAGDPHTITFQCLRYAPD